MARLQGGNIVKQYYYDAAGQMITEANADGTTARAEIYAGSRHLATWSNNATYFNHADWLGTERVRSFGSGTKTGLICETITSLPFGDGLNTFPQNDGCAPEPSPYHFTGKERDSESGLDNFGARYDASSLGRFMTPDPLLNSGRPDDPQSWNRYAYVTNNPLRFRDPLGLYKWATDCDEANDSACKADRNRFRAWYAGLKNAAANLDEGSKERKQLDKEIKRIGEEGKGKVEIAFGDAGQDANGNPNAGRTFGNTITLNLAAIDQMASSWGKSLGYDQSQTAALSNDLGIGLLGHEGGHLSAIGLLGLSFMMHTERTALYGESATDQGLHYTDLVYKLWNESWAKVDVGTREEFRNEGIQNELNRQGGKEPSK
jgi:RHS repeat-associated protein